MKKSDIFRALYKSYVARGEYIDKVPNDIVTYVFDNKYVNLLQDDNSMMMCILFGEHMEAVEWFLYEWDIGKCAAVHNKEYYFKDIEEYIDYMKANEGFE